MILTSPTQNSAETDIRASFILEQTDNLAVDQIDLARGRHLRQPRMVMTSPQIITTNSAPAASRTSRTLTGCGSTARAQLGIGGKRVLGLGHADRIVAVTVVAAS